MEILKTIAVIWIAALLLIITFMFGANYQKHQKVLFDSIGIFVLLLATLLVCVFVAVCNMDNFNIEPLSVIFPMIVSVIIFIALYKNLNK